MYGKSKRSTIKGTNKVRKKERKSSLPEIRDKEQSRDSRQVKFSAKQGRLRKTIDLARFRKREERG